MAPRKQKPQDVETLDVEHRVCITRDQLEAALKENMIRKTGSQPIEGQLDDLWRRLREA